MELLIKLYSDKPSKIGVKYLQEYSAVRAYEDIFRKNYGDAFSLKMEMAKDRLNLLLTSEQTGGQLSYKELEYKIEHLKKLDAYLSPGAGLQFVHVFSKANTLMIARPFRSRRFITITRYEIVGPGIFAGRI